MADLRLTSSYVEYQYQITDEQLAPWFAAAYQRAYQSKNPAFIADFTAMLADHVHMGYLTDGNKTPAYQAHYNDFMQQNEIDMRQEPEKNQDISLALAKMTLWGIEAHKQTNIFQRRLYIGVLESLLTDLEDSLSWEQVKVRVFIQQIRDSASTP